MTHEELLEDLIRIKSYSGEEGEIASFIGKWLQERGIDSINQEGNVVALLAGEDSSRVFIFNSHMDTVNKGDGDWRTDPWKPTAHGDKLVGLGASDMKSGLAATMLTAEKMADQGTPPVDVFFTYVTREEEDGSGTQSFAQWFKAQGHDKKYRDMAAIFGEPSSLSEIEIGHRGNIFVEAKTTGDSGHASRPDAIKRHAVREMMTFADALKEKAAEWHEEFSGTPFEPPTIGELTSIQSGVVDKDGVVTVASPNKFPQVCTATFDVRTVPAFHKVAFARIKELGDQMGVEIGYAFPPAPAGYTDPEERIVKIAQEVVPGAKLAVAKGSGDLGFLTDLGIKGISIGPGEKGQAHATNEYCYPDQIPQAVEIYSQIVKAWAQ